MRRRSPGWGLWLLTALVACGDSSPDPKPGSPGDSNEPASPQSTASSPAATPRRVWKPDGKPENEFARITPFVHLGVVDLRDPVEVELEVFNKHDAAMRVVQVSGSCDCSTYSFDRAEFGPGETGKVFVTVRPRSDRGNKDLEVDVRLGTGDLFPMVHSRLRYFSRPAVTVKPMTVQFGRRKVGEDHSIDVELSFRLPAHIEPQPLSVTLADADVPVRFELGEAVGVDPTMMTHLIRIPLRLTLDCSAPADNFRTQLIFDSDQLLPSQMTLTGGVHPGWFAQPDKLHLGAMKVGKSKAKTFSVVWFDDAPFEVEDLRSSSELVEVQVAERLPEKRTIRLEVTLSPQEAGSFQGQIEVVTNRSEQPIVVPVAAFVRG